MISNTSKGNKLHGMAQFALFVSSYLPLFILIIGKQISTNYLFIHWGGISWISIFCFFKKFGLSFLLSIIIIYGLIGFSLTLLNIETAAKNGFPVIVKDVKNKNSESIGYIATYIIPFLFQSFDGPYECLAVLLLLIIIYRIYINSSLLLINPLLSIWYSLYEIEYDIKGKKCTGLIITRDKFLQDDSAIKLYEIGYKLYFSLNIEPK